MKLFKKPSAFAGGFFIEAIKALIMTGMAILSKIPKVMYNTPL